MFVHDDAFDGLRLAVIRESASNECRATPLMLPSSPLHDAVEIVATSKQMEEFDELLRVENAFTRSIGLLQRPAWNVKSRADAVPTLNICSKTASGIFTCSVSASKSRHSRLVSVFDRFLSAKRKKFIIQLRSDGSREQTVDFSLTSRPESYGPDVSGCVDPGDTAGLRSIRLACACPRRADESPAGSHRE